MYRELNDLTSLKNDWQRKVATFINKEGCADNINLTDRYTDALGNGYCLQFNEGEVVLMSDNAGGKLGLSLKSKFKFNVALSQTTD